MCEMHINYFPIPFKNWNHWCCLVSGPLYNESFFLVLHCSNCSPNNYRADYYDTLLIRESCGVEVSSWKKTWKRNSSFYTFRTKVAIICLYILSKVNQNFLGNFLANIVLSAAQYKQVIRIFDMFSSCYKRTNLIWSSF